MESMRKFSREIEERLNMVTDNISWSLVGEMTYLPDQVLLDVAHDMYNADKENDENEVSDLIPAAMISTDKASSLGKSEDRSKGSKNFFHRLSKAFEGIEKATADANDSLCWSMPGDVSFIPDNVILKASEDIHKADPDTSVNPLLYFSKKFSEVSEGLEKDQFRSFFHNLSIRSSNKSDSTLFDSQNGSSSASVEAKYTIGFGVRPVNVSTKRLMASNIQPPQVAESSKHNLTFISRFLKDPEFKAVSLHCSLAPCYGILTNGSATLEVDKTLEIALDEIQNALNAVCKESPLNLDFNRLADLVAKNRKLVSVKESRVTKREKFSKSSRPLSCPNPQVANLTGNICSWYNGWVEDDDIIRDSKIDMKPFLRTFCADKTKQAKFFNVTGFDMKENDEINVYEVGILRYPELKTPFVKLYKIKVNAWKATTRLQNYHEFEDGFEISFDSQIFNLDPKTISRMTKRLEKKAVDLAQSLWNKK